MLKITQQVTLQAALAPEPPAVDIYVFAAKHLVTFFYELHLILLPFLDSQTIRASLPTDDSSEANLVQKELIPGL